MATVLRETMSGIVVADQALDERQVDRALKERERMLFLDKEVWRGRLVYAVRLYVPDSEPLDVLYWHDGHGNPLPLSSGILDRLDSLRKEHGYIPAHTMNTRRDEQLAADAGQDYEDLAREMLPRIGTTRSHVRSVSTPERARRNTAERRKRGLQ